MNFSEINKIIDKIDQSSIKEIHLKQGDFELVLSKNEFVNTKTPDSNNQVVASQLNKQNGIEEAVLNDVTEVSIEETIVESTVEPEGDLVSSPLVGVVYLQPAPDKAKFVEVGSQVNKGDTLCIVEAMKVMNEIPADKSGVISEVLIDAETVVEFGQPLFRIK
ncbi:MULTISPECIES: acetyl-CoA carboxylase biotin carboxyl carrier protein [unclassified Enterococcus]|uniref:acetyl-CoA carboxylase biotin carboxyl carrier protein n=1 Tax=unclassified Enterococcus TaxID=2608891 RepID=UPI0015518496|nr:MULTISPECIES: acetyl-CoA carboxylase biotin carboxyl carrier protein [unclassified Enterococcus]MBS7577296.1 acetyl-CoA carboxylase biotin carboxyl carrier protein [Enterococcus sp. MMGLQ5-2]MBS7584611.1 acetyl-CoA carboxylase biotin carboxyl carrier protein [Enterococcus sp. MMGLQ5-1]NPD12466.1 acetyl-CoA carboxylase biotin carboxyl carrier protein [Enterococcus sp. MMGLQ5-1]NPD37130.1 acetyl-CoA carboxylase biotin carboxyl carrier protein [Enterococcus sp. MMGLQ5-2]